MRILFAHEHRERAAQIAWAAELLLAPLWAEVRCIGYEELPAEAGDVVVSYGRAAARGARLHIADAGFFGEAHLTARSLPSAAPVMCEGVPVVFGAATAPAGAGVRADGRITASCDLVASAFFLATRYEEHLRPERDAHGRFDTARGYECVHGFSDRPVVDEITRLLHGWLREVGVNVERRRPFGDREFAIALTHDIDKVAGGWLESGFHALRSLPRRPCAAVREMAGLAAGRLRGRDPYWSFDAMLGLEERHGARSTLYFLPRTGHAMDARYDFADGARFAPLFERLRAGGWEIGLHGSFESAFTDGLLAREKLALERASSGPVTGQRQHYLRWLVQDGWRRHAGAGFAYDASLGFADRPGFRGSIARPFRAFDLAAGRALDLWELPLVVMDQTFRSHGGLPADRVWERIEPLLAQMRDHGGAAAVLWHNSFFAGGKFAGWELVYERLLRWVAAEGGTCVTGAEAVGRWAGSVAGA